MTIRTTATRRLEWDAAHRVMNHESKCATLHGHRYVALITVTAEQLDDVSRVVDFGAIKQIVGGWIDDNWDHTTLLNSLDDEMINAFNKAHQSRKHRKMFILQGEPTAEVMASFLLVIAQSRLNQFIDQRPDLAPLMVTRVRLYETPNCYADAEIV